MKELVENILVELQKSPEKRNQEVIQNAINELGSNDSFENSEAEEISLTLSAEEKNRLIKLLCNSEKELFNFRNRK